MLPSFARKIGLHLLTRSKNITNDDSNDDMPVREKSTNEEESSLRPTDVGLMPWLQVVGGYFLMFNNWGLVMSYGTFQTYYTSGGGIVDEDSPSTIAWIGSVQVFLLLFGGALGGKYFDAGYMRQMVCLGSFLMVFGMMMVSLSTKYYQVMLAQGICVGIGMGLTLIPAVGTPGTWFSKRRGLAVGLVTMGSSIGGIVYPVMLHNLGPQVGYPWAARIMAFVSLATLSISIILLRQRLPPRKRGSFIEYAALREPAFAFYSAGIFIAFLGFFTFYNFIEEWAIHEHIDTHGLPVFYILPVANGASAIGRVLPNFISDYLGPLNLQAPSIFIAGVLVLTWLPAHTLAPVIVLTVLYGFFSGASVGLPPAAVASMTTDMQTFGGRIGVIFMAMGLSSLIGSPVTGAIVQSQGGGYDGARIWAGVTMLIGGCSMGAARFYRTEWKLAGKV